MRMSILSMISLIRRETVSSMSVSSMSVSSPVVPQLPALQPPTPVKAPEEVDAMDLVEKEEV